MKMHIGGKWMDSDDRIDVVNPFDGTTIDTVPKATPQDVSDAIAAAA
ncbi:MAG: aldehyde dehydrogenase family protein, partial [Candidatus Latescibacterota bacterium]